MENKLRSESYKPSTGLAGGDPASIANAMSYLDSIWVLPVGVQRRVVADMWDAMITSITSYSCKSPGVFMELRGKLANVSDKLGLDAYEYVFSLMRRYDDIPDNSAHDLNLRNLIDTNVKGRVIMLGAIIARLHNNETSLSDDLKQRILASAEKALEFAFKHGGPDTRVVAKEALEMFNGLDMTGFVPPSEENRNDCRKAVSNRNFFEKKYPHEALPKRFIIDATYESIDKIFSSRMPEKDFEYTVAVRQLKSLLISSEQWGNALFPKETDLDYENQLERELLVTDIQNTLLHVVKTGKDDSIRTEVAKTLVRHGGERMKDVFNNIVKKREDGFEFIRKFTVQKPDKEAKRPVSDKPVPKKAVR